MSILPTSWSEARDTGAKRFFTGKPCKRGHIADRIYPQGRCSACAIEATKEWRSNNPEKVSSQWKRYHAEKRDEICARKRAYEAENRDAVRERKRDYMRENNQRFRRKLKLATPAWLTESDRIAIDEFYAEARRRTDESGKPHEVDHIVPINGETVCGLHVPWNLQVLTQFSNRSKGNRHAS